MSRVTKKHWTEDYPDSPVLDSFPMAQPGQEPVLFIHPSTLAMASAHVGAWKPGHELEGYVPLHLARQPLTDEQIEEIHKRTNWRWGEFARAIEAAHGIKENT